MKGFLHLRSCKFLILILNDSFIFILVKNRISAQLEAADAPIILNEVVSFCIL